MTERKFWLWVEFRGERESRWRFFLPAAKPTGLRMESVVFVFVVERGPFLQILHTTILEVHYAEKRMCWKQDRVARYIVFSPTSWQLCSLFPTHTLLSVLGLMEVLSNNNNKVFFRKSNAAGQWTGSVLVVSIKCHFPIFTARLEESELRR